MPTPTSQPNPQPQAPQEPTAMPAQMTTPQQVHQEVAQAVASNIGQILGSDIPVDEVMPLTEDTKPVSPEKEQLQEMTNRIFLNKPGYEPSKSFLKKMWERLKKKNPDAVVTLKEE